MPLPPGYKLDQPAAGAPKLPPGYMLDSAPAEVATAAAAALPPGPLGLDGQPLPLSHINKAGIPVYQGTPASAGRYTSNAPAAPPTDWRTPLTKVHPHGEGDGSSWLDSGSGDIRDMMADPLAVAREVAKTFANIGGSGLSLALHPVYSVKMMARQLLDSPQAATELANQAVEQPLETGEGMIGQAGVTGLAGEAIPRVLRGARDVAEGTVRRLAGSGPAVATKLVRAATEDNRTINLHNADKLADAQQKWQEAQTKAVADHQAELLRLRQKWQQDTRTAAEKARTGTDADRAVYQSKQLAAKQKYEQDVRDQTEKFTRERAKAEQANVEALRAHNQKIGETVQNNKAATEAEQAKSAQNAKLQVGGSQLIYGLRQLDGALRARAAQMYDAIREKVGGQTMSGTNLAQAAKTAMSKISGTSVTPTVFRDILGKYPEADPEALPFTTSTGGTTMISKGHPMYNFLKENGAAASTPVTFKDLQGYHSELGAELSKGTLPGDVYQATRDLQESITDMMQDMAKKADANNDLINARKFYREYMDTFHEPTGPSASGSPVAQALLAKDPLVAVDKFAGDSGDRGIAFLRKYSDPLANLAQDVRRTKQAEIKVPARKTMVGTSPKTTPVPVGSNLPLPGVVEAAPAPRATNLPLPPVLPDVEQVPYRQPKLTPTRTISLDDLTRANDAAVHARGQSAVSRLLGWSAVYPAFRMLAELTRTGGTSLRPLAAVPAAGAVGMTVESLLEHPPVMDFLRRATREQIARIPPELRGDMPRIVEVAKSHGVQISPLLAAYASTIQRNQRTRQILQPAQPLATQGASQ